MTVTTKTGWQVIDRLGATWDLQTLAYNISSWGDSRQSPPPSRGADIVIPWIPGQSRQPKIPDAKTITLAMWVCGADVSGATPIGGRRLAFESNWRQLRALLWNYGEPFTLVKKFLDVNGQVVTASAIVEFAGGLEPGMTDPYGAAFTVDLLLADPFFYGTPVNIAFDTSTATILNPTILGDWYARRVVVNATSKTGGVSTPGIACTTMSPLVTMQVAYSTATGAIPIVLDSVNQLATANGVSVAGLVTHAGSYDWMRLNPGACTIQLLRASGNWSGTITYTPVWN